MIFADTMGRNRQSDIIWPSDIVVKRHLSQEDVAATRRHDRRLTEIRAGSPRQRSTGGRAALEKDYARSDHAELVTSAQSDYTRHRGRSSVHSGHRAAGIASTGVVCGPARLWQKCKG